MNSSKHGRASSYREHPFHIEYWKGDRMLRDCAVSLDEAKRRVEQRLAKRHNRGETARVLFRGEVVHTS